MTRKVRPEGRSEEEAVAMKWIWVGVNVYRGGDATVRTLCWPCV